MFDKLAQFPPCIIRLLARKAHGLRPLTHAEIAKASGLAISSVVRISLLSSPASWDRLTLETIKRFLKGCRVDINHMAPHKEFLTKRQWVHIEQCSPQQRKFFQRLLSLKGNKK